MKSGGFATVNWCPMSWRVSRLANFIPKIVGTDRLESFEKKTEFYEDIIDIICYKVLSNRLLEP